MHGVCQYPQCKKTAAYNVEGESERAYCKAHCMELFPGREVSNLAGKRCQVAAGCRAQAVWGPKLENGKVQALACVEHKGEGMLRAGARYCVREGCTVRAACGFPVDRPVAETCSRHRLPGMEDLRALRKKRSTSSDRAEDDMDDETEEDLAAGALPGQQASRKRPRAKMTAEGHVAEQLQQVPKQDTEAGSWLPRRKRSPSMSYEQSGSPVVSEWRPFVGGREHQQDAVVGPRAVTAAGDRAASTHSSPSWTAAPAPRSPSPPSSRGEVGSVMGVQADIVPGDGCICFSIPSVATELSSVMQESARVSVSWVKLHQDVLTTHFSRAGPGGWRSRLDSTVDVKLQAPSSLLLSQTETEGGQAAAAAGCAIACRTLSSLTRCALRDGVTVLGELSLGGRVLPVKGAEEKLKAVRKGMVFLPWQHDATGMEGLIQPGVRAFRVRSLAAVLPVLMDSTAAASAGGQEPAVVSLGPLATRDYACVSSTVPGLQAVEVAVFAGKGEVVMTGRLKLPALNSLGASLVWLRKSMSEVFDKLRLVRGRRVSSRFDLITMERRRSAATTELRPGGFPGSETADNEGEAEAVDVHIHLPGLDVPKYDSSHGPAAVLGLVSVLTGLPLPQGLAVHASLSANGSLEVPSSPSSVSELEAALASAAQSKVRMLLVPTAVEEFFQMRVPPGADVQVVGVGSMLDAIQAVFGPQGSECGWGYKDATPLADVEEILSAAAPARQDNHTVARRPAPAQVPRMVHTYPALGQRLYHQPTDVATRYPAPINTSGSNENETTWEPEEALLRMRGWSPDHCQQLANGAHLGFRPNFTASALQHIRPIHP